VFLLRGEEKENATSAYTIRQKILGWATYKKKIFRPELVWLLPYPALLRSAPDSRYAIISMDGLKYMHFVSLGHCYIFSKFFLILALPNL